MSKIKYKPPILALWIIGKITLYDDKRALKGDIEEDFYFFSERYSRIYAWFYCWKQVIKSIFSFIKYYFTGSFSMLKNYFKITIRNIRRQKSYSFINIAGLTLGISCCLIILVYILDELSYDRYHKNSENIYRVVTIGEISGRPIDMASVPAPMGPTMAEEFSEVINSVRFNDFGEVALRYKNKSFYESDLLYADNSVFNVFSFELVKGDPESALAAPFTMVITEEKARKYFGDEEALGKSLQDNNGNNYTISGIIKKPSSNSHFTFEILASFRTLISNNIVRENFWGNMAYHTYILLQKDFDYRDLEAKLPEFDRKHFKQLLKAVPGIRLEHHLQPLTSIHLHSNLEFELSGNGNINYIYAFGSVAVFILLIACINFMNLTTARSGNRMKEIGMRKVVGAYKKQIRHQFFAESMLFSIISLIFALLIVKFAEPLLNSVSGKNIDINYLKMPELSTALFFIIIFVGLAAGIYPAVFMSNFKPVNTLKNNYRTGGRHSTFRNILVISQFVISIFLIIGSVTIFNQIKYMKNKHLGFDKDHLLVLRLPGNINNSQIESLKSEVKKISGVVNASASSSVPGRNMRSDGYFPEGLNRAEPVVMRQLFVDYDFIDTYGIELLSGRNFSKERTSDLNNVILVNEISVKNFGWKNPINKKIEEFASYDLDLKPRTVIGVVKNFHVLSLYNTIEPVQIAFDDRFPQFLTIRLNPENINNSIKKIKEKWAGMFPGAPFRYDFLDETFDDMYKNEEKLNVLFQIFTVLSIFIGSLGLFGLASFTAEKRTKEIGIRKTLGSSVISVIYLLLKNYIILLAVSNVIAWPLCYYVMKNWLSKFPYQAGIYFGTFLLAAFLTLTIAIITVSYRTIKAALANPVKALKYE